MSFYLNAFYLEALKIEMWKSRLISICSKEKYGEWRDIYKYLFSLEKK